MYAWSHAAPFGMAERLSCHFIPEASVVSPAGGAVVTFSFLARSWPAFLSAWWSRIMSLPNVLTSELVPLVAATDPDALSTMFAASRMATMLGSVSVGAGGGAGVAGVAAALAALAESAAFAESADLSPLAQAAITAAEPSAATVERRGIRSVIGPPNVCLT